MRWGGLRVPPGLGLARWGEGGPLRETARTPGRVRHAPCRVGYAVRVIFAPPVVSLPGPVGGLVQGSYCSSRVRHRTG